MIDTDINIDIATDDPGASSSSMAGTLSIPMAPPSSLGRETGY